MKCGPAAKSNSRPCWWVRTALKWPRTIVYQVPQGITPGPLYFTVADGMSTNLAEFRQILGAQPKSAAQLISIVNGLRANTKAYVRVWRPEPAYQLEGADFPDPPPSVALILGGLADRARQCQPDAKLQSGGIGNRRRGQRY